VVVFHPLDRGLLVGTRERHRVHAVSGPYEDDLSAAIDADSVGRGARIAAPAAAVSAEARIDCADEQAAGRQNATPATTPRLQAYDGKMNGG
jgi:hypothetical protein